MKTYEVKAEPLTTSQLDRWLAGRIPRRTLVIPFGGPLSSPHSAKGVDAEFEFFDEQTDLYGPYPWLRQSRERLVDWHHTTFLADGYKDPVAGRMKGAVLGRIVMDEEPSAETIDDVEYEGVWADFWANAGERRRQLVASLERRNVPMYGSSQPVAKAVKVDDATGHIDVWPVRFHTITTAPVNHHAVLPPVKAWLDDPFMAELSVGALRAYLTGSDDLASDLLPIAPGDGPAGNGGAKAGQVPAEAEVEAALGRLLEAIERFHRERSTHRKRTST